MQEAMLESGSIEVDVVSGATVTSTAVKDAASQAYEEIVGQGDAQQVAMKPGVYMGYANGFWEEVPLPVAVTVSETAITKIELPRTPEDRLTHMETEVMLNSVREDLVPRIIESQSIACDATTGATSTSGAVQSAIRDALEKACEAAGSPKSSVRAFLEPPVIPNPGEPIEKTVDVLVVGLGAGGVCAMKSACETMRQLNPPANSQGRVSILGIDRAGRFGGRSGLTHEGCAVNPPRYQEIANGGEPFVDEKVFRDYYEKYLTTDGVTYGKPEMVDLFFKESGPTIDWLYDNGWTFGSMEELNPYSGGYQAFNVALTSYLDEGSFADRQLIQESYYRHMLDQVVSAGGEYWLNTEGYEFLVDENDRVVGVKARNLRTGQEYVIHAKAVIENTGGFLNCPELIDRFWPEEWRGERKCINTGQDTGELLKAALEIGAGTYNEQTPPAVLVASTDHWINNYEFSFTEGVGWNGRPEEYSLNGIPAGVGNAPQTLAVNKKGDRYYCEDDSKLLVTEFSDQYKSGNFHWRIVSQDMIDHLAQNGFDPALFLSYRDRGPIPECDAAVINEAMDYAVDEGMAFKADTVEELATMLDGVEADRLIESVKRYNELCEKGEDDDFGKDAHFLVPAKTGPFYGVQMWAWTYCAVAALDVDEQIRVLRDDHKTPIEGLYCVGSESLGVILNPNRTYEGFGFLQGWSWLSGRLAGSHAARYINDTYGLAQVGLIQNPDSSLNDPNASPFGDCESVFGVKGDTVAQIQW